MVKAGIVSGTGYTGNELLRVFAQPKNVEITAITSRGEAVEPVSELFPSLRHRLALRIDDSEAVDLANCDRGFFPLLKAPRCSRPREWMSRTKC